MFIFILLITIFLNILIIFASIQVYFYSNLLHLSNEIDFLIIFLLIWDVIVMPHFYLISKIVKLFRDPIGYEELSKFSVEKSLTIFAIKYTRHTFYISLTIFSLSIVVYFILNHSLFDPSSFSFSMLTEYNYNDVVSFLLQIIITLSFFWFYGIFTLMLISKTEFFYYNITRAYIFSINLTHDNYKKLKYLVEGLMYYQKFLQQNLNLKIKSMNCLYDNILSSDNRNSFLSLTKSFEDTSNKLLPFQEIIKLIKKEENECLTETILRNTKVYFEIIISSIIPIIIIVLEKLSP
jgi:hypothetical protein